MAEVQYPQYYIGTTEYCDAQNKAKALAEGCGPVTQYWWTMIQKWDDPSQTAIVLYQEPPPELQPTVDELPIDWYAPDSVERELAEERQRNA